MMRLAQARFRLVQRIALLASYFRSTQFKVFGMSIGRGCAIGKIHVNWPNQVCIGANCQVCDSVKFDYCYGIPMSGPNIVIGENCYVGHGVEFNIRKSVRIGNDCLVAAGVRFIDHDHGIALDALIREQEGPESSIEVGDDVWIGVNAVILKGVVVGKGAVIAAGAVVNRSIPDSEIWGGVPAKLLGRRPMISRQDERERRS